MESLFSGTTKKYTRIKLKKRNGIITYKEKNVKDNHLNAYDLMYSNKDQYRSVLNKPQNINLYDSTSLL